MTVTIYSRQTCAPCQTLKRYLTHKKVDYTEIDADSVNMQELYGSCIVPITVINDDIVSGLNLAKIANLLKA